MSLSETSALEAALKDLRHYLRLVDDPQARPALVYADLAFRCCVANQLDLDRRLERLEKPR